MLVKIFFYAELALPCVYMMIEYIVCIGMALVLQ